MNDNAEKPESQLGQPEETSIAKQLADQNERLIQLMDEIALIREQMSTLQQEYQQMKDDQGVRNTDRRKQKH